MDSSIINTNQIGMTGIPFSDDYYDDNWKLGISHKKMIISLKTDRTTVYFDSRVPTQREIIKSTIIIITSETEWNPQLVQLALVHN